MAKVDSFFLRINKESYTLLIKERIAKLNQMLAEFVFQSIPKMKDYYSNSQKIIKKFDIFFKEKVRLSLILTSLPRCSTKEITSSSLVPNLILSLY